MTCCLMTTFFLGAKNICIPQLIESQKTKRFPGHNPINPILRFL
jgi:hypothetical protein